MSDDPLATPVVWCQVDACGHCWFWTASEHEFSLDSRDEERGHTVQRFRLVQDPTNAQ